ncbi:hypothetical protein ES707_21033 [subsurface metagenome]
MHLMIGGSTLKAACRAVGIDYATGRRWAERDRDFGLAVRLSRVLKRIRKLARENRIMKAYGFLRERSAMPLVFGVLEQHPKTPATIEKKIRSTYKKGCPG